MDNFRNSGHIQDGCIISILQVAGSICTKRWCSKRLSTKLNNVKKYVSAISCKGVSNKIKLKFLSEYKVAMMKILNLKLFPLSDKSYFNFKLNLNSSCFFTLPLFPKYIFFNYIVLLYYIKKIYKTYELERNLFSP